MRLIFINRFYWPETPATGQLLTDLAVRLAGARHEVTVITSHPGTPGLAARERNQAVDIHRIRGTRWGGAGLAGKAVDFATFHLGALWGLLRTARRGTIVIAMTDPPLIGIAGWLVARLRGAQVIHWVQDIYPDLAIELAGQRWLRVLLPLRDLAWRRADACVTLGEDMAGVLAAAGVPEGRRTIIPNWAPAGLAPQPPPGNSPLRERWGLTGKFVVAYAGNLGRVHDLEPLLAVAEAFRGEPRFAFVFIGAGARRDALAAEARRLGLDHVFFHPSQPREQLTAALALADVHLVTLLPGCERLVFPSKLYGIAAVGRPLIFIGPAGCEIARLVERHGLGGVAERGDPAGVIGHIRRLETDRGGWQRHAAAAAQFAATNDIGTAVGRWHAQLDTLRPCRPPPPAATTLAAR